MEQILKIFGLAVICLFTTIGLAVLFYFIVMFALNKVIDKKRLWQYCVTRNSIDEFKEELYELSEKRAQAEKELVELEAALQTKYSEFYSTKSVD